MIDYFYDIMSEIENLVDGIPVVEESGRIPSSFPCVTIAETNNVTRDLDSDQREKFANVTYRITAWSDSDSGKRTEAQGIMNAIDRWMISSNFRRISVTRRPEYYNSAFSIMSIYEACIGDNGQIYRG